jgi:hypothetical protein
MSNNITPTSSTSADTAALVQRLFQGADSNQDGTLTTQEFTDFLTSVLKTAEGIKTIHTMPPDPSPNAGPGPVGPPDPSPNVGPGPIGPPDPSPNGNPGPVGPPTSIMVPSAAGGGSFLYALEGFDLTRLDSAANTPKYAFANLAKNLAPTQENLQHIASQLGDSKGFVDSDGLTFILRDSNGYIGVRDRGWGPMWQWMAYNDEHPDPEA